MSNPAYERGRFTEDEIGSEPRCWTENLSRLQEDPAIAKIVRECSHKRPWLFVGCGSSYYLALAAAASWEALTGLPARAAPASDLLLFPDLILDHGPSPQPVLISRSGTTSEILQAGEYLNARSILFVAVTCSASERLEELAVATVRLFAAGERSTVMTLSFTSMLMAIQFLAARLAGNEVFLDGLLAMPQAFQPVLHQARPAVKSFLESQNFADYVWLGQGPYYGLACEGALKVSEMSCSYAQAFHTLEFRHGPKSIVGPETLIMFQLSEAGFKPERDLLEEVKGLGGTTLVVVNKADERTRRAADLLVELNLEGHEYARLAAHIVPAQLVGLEAGLKKGLDPDSPRNLSRAVILGDRI